MATFTLTDLRNEVSKKYAPTIITNGKDKYTLQNLLQLPATARGTVLDLIDTLGGDEDSGLDHQLSVFADVIVNITLDGKGQELLDLLDGNDAMLVELGTKWMDTSQVGEAEPS